MFAHGPKRMQAARSTLQVAQRRPSEHAYAAPARAQARGSLGRAQAEKGSNVPQAVACHWSDPTHPAVDGLSSRRRAQPLQPLLRRFAPPSPLRTEGSNASLTQRHRQTVYALAPAAMAAASSAEPASTTSMLAVTSSPASSGT